MTHVSSILIVGAGQAAAVAAAALREQNYQGRITVVGDETHAPYERPPLSKSVLAAVQEAEPAIAVKEADFFTAKNVDLRLGVRVVSLDTNLRQAALSDGATLQYDRCLLATGGSARELPGMCPDSNHIHYLRTLDDARALRVTLGRCRRILVIGGGFLGLEIASTALDLGVQVTIIETASRVLGRAVPPEFSMWLQERIALSGVALHLGQPIAALQAPATDSADAQAVLEDGATLVGDAIVAAVGLVPNTGLAKKANLRIDPANGGICVDSQCRTSDPRIYAAGDCTSQNHPGSPNPLRMESWQNANEQGRIAASAMLGRETAAPAFPWFWTDQFGCNIQMLGIPQPDLQYIARGRLEPGNPNPKFIMLGLRDGKPYHALAINAGGDLRAIRPLLEQALPINTSQFTDESIALRGFAKSTLANAPAAR